MAALAEPIDKAATGMAKDIRASSETTQVIDSVTWLIMRHLLETLTSRLDLMPIYLFWVVAFVIFAFIIF